MADKNWKAKSVDEKLEYLSNQIDNLRMQVNNMAGPVGTIRGGPLSLTSQLGELQKVVKELGREVEGLKTKAGPTKKAKG